MGSQVYGARIRALDVLTGRQPASASLVGHFETASSAAKQSATLNLHNLQVSKTTIFRAQKTGNHHLNFKLIVKYCQIE